MIKRPLFALALTAGLVAPVSAAQEARYALSLQVPVMCSIIDAYSDAPQSGQLTVITNCNAERYGLTFGGALAGYSVVQSSNTRGSAIAGTSGVSIHAIAPGMSQTNIQLDGDLTEITDATLSLTTF